MDAGDSDTQTALRNRIEVLKAEHETLNQQTDALCRAAVVDYHAFKQLKLRKLQLKDEILKFEANLPTDIA